MLSCELQSLSASIVCKLHLYNACVNQCLYGAPFEVGGLNALLISSVCFLLQYGPGSDELQRIWISEYGAVRMRDEGHGEVP